MSLQSHYFSFFFFFKFFILFWLTPIMYMMVLAEKIPNLHAKFTIYLNWSKIMGKWLSSDIDNQKIHIIAKLQVNSMNNCWEIWFFLLKIGILRKTQSKIECCNFIQKKIMISLHITSVSWIVLQFGVNYASECLLYSIFHRFAKVSTAKYHTYGQ